MSFQLTSPSQSASIILGIDPGLRCTGYGVIRVEGKRLSAIGWGTVVPILNDRTQSQTAPLAHRLKQIVDGLQEIIATHRPQYAAIEIVFVNVNPQSTLLLGQARGAAIAALVQANLPVHELTALQVKQGIVGYGRASKEQIRFMVKQLLGISENTTMSYDAADALAVAISAHFQTQLTFSSQQPSSDTAGNLLQAFRKQSRRKRQSTRWKSTPE